MPEAIKREFRNHPLGTTFVLMTCISLLIGGVSWTYAKGSDANDSARDITEAKQAITAVAQDLKEHLDDKGAHPSYQEQVEQFPTRREFSNTVIEIKKTNQELKSEMQEQRKLQIEILKRLPRQ